MEYNQTRIELGALATAMFYAAQKDRINAFNRIRQIIYRKIEGKDHQRNLIRRMKKINIWTC